MSNKRNNIFGQGRPERPYEDRDEPIDPPKTATAAQMASRKIKGVKGTRRPTGASSTPASGVPMPPTSYTFLGGNATNNTPATFAGIGSPPPDQNAVAPPSNSFTFGSNNNNNNNAPAFGGSVQQPEQNGPMTSSSFTFGSTAGGNNNTTSIFGGSALGQQPEQNAGAMAPGFAFGSNAGSNNNNNGPSMFGNSGLAKQPEQSTGPPTSSSFSFGGNNNTPTFGASVQQPEQNAGAKTSGFTFGASTSGNNNSNTGSIFGGQPPQQSAGALPSSNFTFGASTSNAGSNNNPTGSIFGNTSSAGNSNNVTGSLFSNFGSAQQPEQKASALPSSNFNFSTTANQNNNSAQDASQGFKFLSGTNPFAASAPAPASAPTNGGLFGTANKAGGLFGASTTGGLSGNSTAGGLFSASTAGGLSGNSTTAGNSTTGGLFGSSLTSTAPTAPVLGTSGATNAAPTASLFGASGATNAAPTASLFGASGVTNAAPTASLFGDSGAKVTGPSVPSFKSTSPAPASSMFGSSAVAKPASTSSMFGSSAATTTEPVAAPMFGSVGATGTASTTFSTEDPFQGFKFKSNPFAASTQSLPEASGPSNVPNGATPTSSSKSLFGQKDVQRDTEKDTSSMPALTAAAAPPSEAPKASEVLSNTPKNQASGVSFEAPKPEVPAESAKTSEELFNAPKTGGVSSEAPKAGQLPRIPRAHVPATWVAPKAMQTDLQALTVQLLSLNNQYRSKLISLSPTADWSPLSQWHAKATTEIMQKIVTAKKQLAAAKGVTGNESSLSVKRKAVANDDAADLAYDASPSKKQREAKMPATPVSKTSSLFSTTPKDTPPSETSNLFGSVFNKDTGATTSNLFGSVSNKSVAETSEKSGMASKDDEPTKAATPQTGFSFTNSTATTTPKPAASQSLFQMPSASSSSKTNVTAPAPTTASQNGFSFGKSTATAGPKPAASQSLFKMPTPSSGGPGSGFSLIGQFSTKAKSYEELVAERKAKDKDNDYDSDDEDYEEWSTRWDKEEAARVAKDKEATTTDDASTTPKGPNKGFNFLSGVSQPTVGTSGTSSSGLFSPRVASPAPSTGGQSVFDTPEAAQSPASNIFGHLSGGQSSSQDDESDDDDADDHDNDNDNGDNDAYDDDDSGDEREEQEEPYESDIQPTKQSSSEQAQPKKRKVFSSDTESDEETGSGKRPAMFKKPSLADRMTHEASKATDESEKENGNPNPVTSTLFGQANGFQTPVKKPFFFDFAGAGAKTAPPKQDSSAGDQTFKAGTPIKFGSAAKTTPAFQFQPATPGLAEFSATPAKPGPATFSFLNAPNTSNAGSVFSSRAATPLSEPDVSGKESAAGNDDEESEQHAQIDLSGLTAEEKAVYDVIFHADQALCKHQVETGGKKVWENYARGPLWILKNKETGKAIVRMRLSTGTTMLNYNIFPKVKTAVTGSSKKMVSAIGTKKDGKSGNMFFAVKSSDIATEFSNVYNANLPS